MNSTKKICGIAIGFILLLCSCNSVVENKSAEAKNPEDIEVEKFEFVNSTDKNFPIKIAVLNKTISDSTPTINFNDASGKLEVASGNKFCYQISEQAVDIVKKKQEIEGGIFKITYNTDLADEIVYRAELPDGSNAFYHFVAVKKIQDKTYMFEDNASFQFTLADVNTMVEAIQKAY